MFVILSIPPPPNRFSAPSPKAPSANNLWQWEIDPRETPQTERSLQWDLTIKRYMAAIDNDLAKQINAGLFDTLGQVTSARAARNFKALEQADKQLPH